jgi:hypothetical protein
MRLEGHHRRAQAVPASGRHQLRQQRLVTAVDAVEVADRQRHRHAIAAARDAAKDLHGLGAEGADYTNRPSRHAARRQPARRIAAA